MTATEIRDLYMKSYREHKQELEKRIIDGIEKNRKSYCKIRLTDNSGAPLSGKKVKITLKTHDFKYGANLFLLDQFEDEKENMEYRRFFKEHFNLATLPFYWDALEPTEGKPRYDKNSENVYRRPAIDLCMEYCEQNGVLPKLHCLYYDKFCPSWLTGRTEEEIKEKYEERFRQISERYSGRMYEFEVVNELLLRKHKTPLFLSPDVLQWAFSLAEKYFPKETLVLNENNSLPNLAQAKYRAALYMMIENALLKGTRIDKIGVQHHLFTGVSANTPEEYEKSVKDGASFSDPTMMFAGLDVLAELGLPLEITEVTVPTFGDSEEFEELQADILKLWYSVWFSHPAVETIVYWNTVEGYAYTGDPHWVENKCRGGLWHHDLTPKKAATALWELFHQTWHTDLELITNEDGTVEFRGFYGDYDAQVDDAAATFGIHKNQKNTHEIKIIK